jgi:hypothetical protein
MKKDREEGIMKMEELPAVVIKRVGTDFSVYLPDNHPDKDVRRMEEKFIAYDIGKDYEGAETYLLLMKTKDGSLSATYNDKGKLIRVWKSIKMLDYPMRLFILSTEHILTGPSNDKYLYTQEEGDVLKKQYNLKIKERQTNPQIDSSRRWAYIKVR